MLLATSFLTISHQHVASAELTTAVHISTWHYTGRSILHPKRKMLRLRQSSHLSLLPLKKMRARSWKNLSQCKDHLLITAAISNHVTTRLDLQCVRLKRLMAFLPASKVILTNDFQALLALSSRAFSCLQESTIQLHV